MFYGPLHFLIVREIVAALRGRASAPPCRGSWMRDRFRRRRVGARGGRDVPRSRGSTRAVVAVGEAEWNLRTLGLTANVRRGNLVDAVFGAAGEGDRRRLCNQRARRRIPRETADRAACGSRQGSRVLVVEPIARRPVPFWTAWAEAFRAAGGRADTWRFPAVLPERMRLLDKAAGLDHRELTARSLWLG